MLEEVIIIVWVEERLDLIWTVDGSVGNVFAESGKIVINSLFQQ